MMVHGNPQRVISKSPREGAPNDHRPKKHRTQHYPSRDDTSFVTRRTWQTWTRTLFLNLAFATVPIGCLQDSLVHGRSAAVSTCLRRRRERHARTLVGRRRVESVRGKKYQGCRRRLQWNGTAYKEMSVATSINQLVVCGPVLGSH